MIRTTARPPAAASLLVLVLAAPALADVEVANVFGDHMVLQREADLPVWGRGDPGEAVEVTLAEATAQAIVDEEGRWRVSLPAMPAGGPHTLTVKGAGSDAVTIRDVLVGEVWLCSGQSNMEWPVRSAMDAALEIASSSRPLIRHFTVPHVSAVTPSEDVPGEWSVCSPETVGRYTACGYFMARRLHAELDVPIGILSSNWGGTRIEPWTPPEGFASVPSLASVAESIAERSPAHPARKQAAKAFVDVTEAWVAEARRALDAGQPLPERPAVPDTLKPPKDKQGPAMLYNAMIHGIVGFPLRGAIWYQGESNLGDGAAYADKMNALIGGWRSLWGIGDFPFYFVQLAPFAYDVQKPHLLPELWEAQASVARDLPNTGMVVINDIGTLDNIHPPNKQDVGLRLANMALARTYGKKGIADTGPTFASLETVGNSLRVKFDHADGLRWRDGDPGRDFEILAAGTGWQPADAKIQGDTVVLSNRKVKAPLVVRFAWSQSAQPNLVNAAGLPTGAFRAGEMPRPDALPRLAEARPYTLALDLDLKQLGPSLSYSADHRDSIGKGFDRIAYLVELEPPQSNALFIWVSMDAFTDDLGKIGIPTAASGASFAVHISDMTVRSNVVGVRTGKGLDGGNIEFWPNNYAPGNGADVPHASKDVYDFGDAPVDPLDGYGSMQVHDHGAKQTLFAINHWTLGADADLGIGNSEGKSRDWTFTGNAAGYLSARLRVFVRTK